MSGGPELDGAVGPGVDSQTGGPLGIPTQCAGSCDQKTVLPIGWRTSFQRRVNYNVKSSLSFVPSLCRETGKFVWPSQSVQVHTESPGSPIDKEYHFFPPDFEDVGKKSRWKTNLNYRIAKIDLCSLAKTNHHHHQQFKKIYPFLFFYLLFIPYFISGLSV